MDKYIFEVKDKRDCYLNFSYKIEFSLDGYIISDLKLLEFNSKREANKIRGMSIVHELYHLNGLYKGKFLKEEYIEQAKGAMCVPSDWSEVYQFKGMDPYTSFQVYMFINTVLTKDKEYFLNGQKIEYPDYTTLKEMKEYLIDFVDNSDDDSYDLENELYKDLENKVSDIIKELK